MHQELESGLNSKLICCNSNKFKKFRRNKVSTIPTPSNSGIQITQSKKQTKDVPHHSQSPNRLHQEAQESIGINIRQ